MGTTNTRVWLVRGKEVLARAQASAGVRDTAREGSSDRIKSALRDCISEIREQIRVHKISSEPRVVLAAGMITSPLGLANVPHVCAPAGINELAAAVHRCHFSDITDLPILLIPGVRSQPADAKSEAVGEMDVMRGEETLCVGLVAMETIKPPATVLNLGSHWKAIKIAADGKIQSSVTSLSGELIHASQTQTILASAVPQERPGLIDADWCERGMGEQRLAGLARALFCVRLLELNRAGTPEQRFSFLVGAFIASDLDALRARKSINAGAPVFLCGGGPIAAAWQHALAKTAVHAIVVSDSQTEGALLTGLQKIAAAVPSPSDKR